MSAAARSLFKTTPNDRKHFPAMNQAHFCWQKYNEFVLCMKKSEGDEGSCAAFRQAAQEICPEEWVNTWDEQRENGNFLGVQEKAVANDHHDAHHH